MAFVSIANACSVELRFTYNSQRAALTLGFLLASPYDATTLQAIAEKCANWWADFGKVYMTGRVTLRETYARALDSSTAPSYTSTLRAGTAGTAGGGARYPNNAAYVISFRTTLRGRANRGRNYWFGLQSTFASDDNVVTSTFRNNLLTLYQRLLPGGASDPTPHRWVVLSRQLDGVATGRAVPITAVVAVDDNLDSQRRRLPGRGL